jgi:uncharacterized protein
MKVFVDTSAWLALNDKDDQYHGAAVSKSSVVRAQEIELVTSGYVVDESITLTRYRVSHNAAVIFGNAFLGSNIVAIADMADEERHKAWTLFKKYEDKELSFTDCTGFVLMRRLKLRDAFVFDDHFRQVSFELF